MNHIFNVFINIYEYANPIIYICNKGIIGLYLSFNLVLSLVLSDFIDLTQVHNFTVSAQDILSSVDFRILSFTGILKLLMQIMKRFVPSY